MPPQLVHAPPSLPHACFASPGAQRFCALQQPGQASQRQRPATQRSPTPHAGAPPQVQPPAALHVSPRTSHETHGIPLRPQVESDEVWHALAPSQQPLAQLIAEQAPPEHWPASHTPAPQLEQATPAVPHAVAAVPARHWPPLQQPFGQVVGVQVAAVLLQLPASQNSPPPQLLHCSPPLPQAFEVVPATHVPFVRQQPDGQVAGEQLGSQVPASQPKPARHVAQLTPPVPQAAAVVPATHMPLLQHPPGQLAAVQATPSQAPASQRPAPQSLHCTPAMPHAACKRPVWQTPPEQQPLGQLAALQPPSQTPPSQLPAPQPMQLAPAVPQATAGLPG